jgi:Sulfotransferase family
MSQLLEEALTPSCPMASLAPSVILFLHIPKTAGTTFEFILENTFGASHCHSDHRRTKVFTQKDLQFVRKFFPRLRSLAGHNLVDPQALSVPDPCFMIFLREPIARVFSHYQDSVTRGKNRMSFEQSLRTMDELENLHVKMISGGRDLEKAKRFLEKCALVGLTEKFDLSLRLLERLSPCRLNLNYKRKVVAPDNSIKKSLENDEKMKAMAKEYNKLDIELYTFAASEIFPNLCARAGIDPSAQVKSYDNYPTEIHLRFILSRFYNQSIFREICKRW